MPPLETKETDGSTSEAATKGPSHRKEASLQCGITSLQKCGTVRMYTLNLGLLFVVQIAFATYIIGSSRTLEKRFGLSSKQFGTINAITDVIEVVSVLFIGYFARHAHKPRLISVSVLFSTLGALLYALPFILFGSKGQMTSRPEMGTGGHEFDHFSFSDIKSDFSLKFMCVGNGSSMCDDKEMALTDENDTSYMFLILACVFLGIGGSFERVLGLAYIDENILSQDAPLYFGLTSSMMPLGPVIGFSLAAICTRLPENLVSSHLTPEDPAYVGAWWLGFLIIGALAFIFAVPMFFYPKHYEQYYIEKDRHLTTNPKLAESRLTLHSIKAGITGFLQSLWKLFTNATLMALLVNCVCGVIVMLVSLANTTRYLEVQFNMPAFKANITAALVLALSCVVGNLSIGIFMKKKKIGVTGSALICAVTDLVIVAVLAILMGVGCDNVPMAGVSTSPDLRVDLDLSCNTHCSCPVSDQSVCGPHGLTYLTPCHAGCSSITNTSHYGNCSCLGDMDMMVSKGACDGDCNHLPLYILLVLITCFFLSAGRVPSTVVGLRIVDPELKSLSLSMVSFAVNLFGFLPAPVLFGALSDHACLVWQSICDTTGACVLYDKTSYRHSIMGTGLGFMVISTVFAFITWFLIRRGVKMGKYKDHEHDRSDTEEQFTDQDTKIPQNTTTKTQDPSSINQEHFSFSFDNKAYHNSVEDLTMNGLVTKAKTKVENGAIGGTYFSEEKENGPLGDGGLNGDRNGIKSAVVYTVGMLTATHKYVSNILQRAEEYTSSEMVAKREIKVGREEKMPKDLDKDFDGKTALKCTEERKGKEQEQGREDIKEGEDSIVNLEDVDVVRGNLENTKVAE